MAWDEWEQLKSQAAERQSTHMRINHVPVEPGGGGTGSGDLVVHEDDLGAVGHEAFILFDKLDKQANVPVTGKGGTGSTSQAAAALKSHTFATGAALDKTAEMWTSQVKSVLQACAHISNHLDYSKKRHSSDDVQIAAALRNSDGSTVSVSKLNEYFK
ncbi:MULTISPECIES: hypothetical protein [unclassified Streptomyces]|uniref:hypothetical protein n=1 Tax=unclassified Streptomyces TaxID=2593676 RepID=UPI0027427C06|nr:MULTISPECIES: hypothetical protein [unclassified Streptomyces]